MPTSDRLFQDAFAYRPIADAYRQVSDRNAALVDAAPGALPRYFMLLDWSGEKVAAIRDFRYAPCTVDGAEYRVL